MFRLILLDNFCSIWVTSEHQKSCKSFETKILNCFPLKTREAHYLEPYIGKLILVTFLTLTPIYNICSQTIIDNLHGAKYEGVKSFTFIIFIDIQI